MTFSSSLCSSLSIANPSRTAISTRFSHKPPKLPLSLAFAILPISTTTAADVSGAIDGTTIVVVSEGFMAALATMLSLTDPEQRQQLQVEVGDDDKEVVREYFNNSGFQRWKKIYGDTDEVNRVQRDIRLGHAKTVEKTLSMLKDEGSLQGVTICDAGVLQGIKKIHKSEQKDADKSWVRACGFEDEEGSPLTTHHCGANSA
ncbi:hypothetical protein JHK85_055006 [Glycine max]|nr:hypothetical protein JHK86_054047 [Glycine max]KAG4928520.1 hypothetical protein JHK85_055006 [Glycine max]